MTRRTLLLIAVLVVSASARAVCAQEFFLNEFATTPTDDSLLDAQPLDTLLGGSAETDWVSQAGHSAANSEVANGECPACGQFCGALCDDASGKEEWDFSNGLLTFLGDAPDHRPTGFLDFNYYHDTRDFNVLTINAGAKLPYDIEYFQFVNYTSQFGNESALENWTDFFTEIHLRRPIAKDNKWLKHLDWTVMWADGGRPQEVGRLGVRWRFHDTPGTIGEFFRDTLKLKYSLNFHVVEDDGSGWQMEHVYRRNFFDGLVYVGGFADHNVNGTADSSDWVAETQVGVKLLGNFYAVAEHRYFSFANSSRFKQGVGIGIEYAVRFQ